MRSLWNAPAGVGRKTPDLLERLRYMAQNDAVWLHVYGDGSANVRPYPHQERSRWLAMKLPVRICLILDRSLLRQYRIRLRRWLVLGDELFPDPVPKKDEKIPPWMLT